MNETCVIFDDNVFPPNCQHGPTLLFEKYSIGTERKPRRFFACSACRDRKDCDFFRWADEVTVKKDENICAANSDATEPCQLYNRLEEIYKYISKDRRFCKTCNQLLMKTEFDHHSLPDHHVIRDVDLTKPSLYLSLKKNNKKEAQYLFTDESLRFVVDTVISLGYTHVLCLGTPRIHEELKTCTKVSSLLMDIDKRYAQFDLDSQFCHYNMFNHHFFDGKVGQTRFINFLESTHRNGGDILIIIDPPFGGLIQVLAHTVEQINQNFKRIAGEDNRSDISDEEGIPAMLFFPYFHEKIIKNFFRSFIMLDYQVDYGNHQNFKSDGKGRKYGSPVRIFTNIKPSKFVLPVDQGYRLCELCERYVYETNKHCFKCQDCTSKDGRPYNHCDECNRCVKSSWKHCKNCKICLLENHDCERVGKTRGCFACGDLSHKLKDCPNRIERNRQQSKINKRKKYIGSKKRKKKKINEKS